MSNPRVRIAVVSDIHAYSESVLKQSETRPSYVEVSSPSDLAGQNPFVALNKLVETEGLDADFLVCCGDLGDKAQPPQSSTLGKVYGNWPRS